MSISNFLFSFSTKSFAGSVEKWMHLHKEKWRKIWCKSKYNAQEWGRAGAISNL